ncbi:MAG: SAM-dependent methyltransferase, partial [Chthoniobacter sp.]|uniref:class I SAM-dependent methyltransferase n=1 Tax=Chthoniobacter sp. TaxID=2510640 RepID=UPI0032A611EC
LREGRRLSFVWRYATRDVTKNLALEEALALLGQALGAEWERAHLFTITGDWQLRCDAGGYGTLKASRPAFAVAPAPEHDREKTVAVDVSEAGWLRALGVTNAEGEARPGMAPKLRQIQRFVELLGHLVDDSPLRAPSAPLRIVDMGAGKGYLTFATAEFFRARGVETEITGVEARAELVELTNRVAREHGFTGLNFVEGTIADFAPPQPLDVLIALHACDTATDDALAKAVQAGATLILAAPCCHKEVRAQLQPPLVLREVLRHGILAEREAEIVTDGLRALLLEMHGYRASVFEFISPEDTSKNLMLSAQRRAQPVDADSLRAQFRALMDFHGLREQRLATLLGE